MTHRRHHINVGDRVAYAAVFLHSIGAYAGPLPHARGTVTEVRHLSSLSLAMISWDGADKDLPATVALSNLARVGPNARFCSC
jgi:hypothetical protein